MNLIFSMLLPAIILSSANAKSRYSLYNNISKESATFSLQTSIDRPDLQATSKYFSNTEENYVLACAENGIWLDYDSAENYQSNRFGSRIIANNSCVERASVAFLWIGSVRLVGEFENGRALPRLNLYNDNSFYGNATIIQEDEPMIAENFSSLILVGFFRTTVQLFDQENFTGNSICVEVLNALSYRDIQDVQEEIGLTRGQIKSIRFGCTNSAKIIA